MGKCTALEAARYLIYLMSDSFDDLSNMKINKLLYYAQGQCLLKNGYPLFDDKIEAWQHGPIVESVYQAFKGYESAPIPVESGSDCAEMDEEAKDLLFDVARVYGRYTASALRNMTHRVGTPWERLYDSGSLHVEIPQSMILEYFKKKEKPIEPVNIPEDEMEFVGYRDKEGYLVLPQEWADEAV